MKSIFLTQGKTTIVDDEDYDFLNQFKWYAQKSCQTFYAARTLLPSKQQLQMHNMLVDTPVGMVADHIDGNGLNNQKSNLRVVTNRQNSQNKHCGKSSKYPGVSWDKRRNKWRAVIVFNYRQYWLGYYDDEYYAAIAYKLAVESTGNKVLYGCDK